MGAMSEPADDTELSVEFQLTEDEIIQSQRFLLSHSHTLRKQWNRYYFVLAAFVLLGFVAFAQALFSGASREALLLPAAFVIATGFLGGYRALQRSRAPAKLLRQMLSEGRNEMVYKRRRMTISPDGMRIDHEAGYSFVRWFVIEKVVGSADAIYIYASSVSAHSIPKRAFESGYAFDHFSSRAAAWHRAAIPGRCVRCGYDLAGNVSGVCPECGDSIRSNAPPVTRPGV